MNDYKHNIILRLNALAVSALCIILLAAFALQFSYYELPCPLCLLQRIGLMLAMIGPLMNIRFGIRSTHYGIMLLSLLFTALVSGRQVLLHIASPGSGYDTVLLGFHMYTWVFILSSLAMLITAFVLLAHSQFLPNDRTMTLSRAQKCLFFLVLFIILGNTIATFIECGPLVCPDNPVHYWLSM